MEKRGDVFRINITPPSTSFPWIRIFRHGSGIRKKGSEVGGINATKGKRRAELAREIGEIIIDNSKILRSLSTWYK